MTLDTLEDYTIPTTLCYLCLVCIQKVDMCICIYYVKTDISEKYLLNTQPWHDEEGKTENNTEKTRFYSQSPMSTFYRDTHMKNVFVCK